MSAAEWLDRVDARMDRTGYHPEKDATVAMSAALRAVLDLHRPEMGWGRIPDFCGVDGRDWPCPTVRAIAEALP